MGRQNPYGSRVVLVRNLSFSLFIQVISLTLCRYCISHRMDDHWHYHLFSPHKRLPRHLLTGHASTPHYHPVHVLSSHLLPTSCIPYFDPSHSIPSYAHLISLSYFVTYFWDFAKFFWSPRFLSYCHAYFF
ncbi:hypothetical protein EDB85DRAFT_1986722, partial [Lactarius pseudohatsudake]